MTQRPDTPARGEPPVLHHKSALRRQLLSARRGLSADDLSAAGAALRDAAIDHPSVRRAGTVAAYVSTGTEPPTGPLLEALLGSGRRVLLPVLRDDADLDWAAYAGPAGLVDGLRGTREPAGDRLGTGAVATAEVVVVPALAVGADGTRLGRGGGSYDRALARTGPGCTVVALLHDGELLAQVPAEPHDRRVDVALTPTTAWARPTA